MPAYNNAVLKFLIFGDYNPKDEKVINPNHGHCHFRCLL
jgi:hypothetical protein